MIQCNGFTLDVIRVYGRCKWAVQATYKGKRRYRAYYYKKEAVKSMEEWVNGYNATLLFEPEFYHNFFSPEDLEIKIEEK
jgi:hypothetical protein